MDYVLFGMGYGATLMLLGWALRTFGPERKYKDVNPEDIDRSILQRRWIRFIQGLGGVISIAGTALVVFTFVVMLINPDDDTGSMVALVTWGFLTLAVLIWCWFYVSSFGVTGVWSREEGYGFRKKPLSSRTRSNEAGLSTTRVVPKPRVTGRTGEPEIGPSLDDAATADVITDPRDDASTEALDSVTTESKPVLAEETDESDESDPEYDFGDSTDTTVPSEIGGRAEAIRRLRERQAKSGNSST